MTSENTFRFGTDASDAGDDAAPTTARDAAGGADTPDGVNAQEKAAVDQQMRDIAEVPAVEVITTSAVHLMSAAAVKC